MKILEILYYIIELNLVNWVSAVVVPKEREIHLIYINSDVLRQYCIDNKRFNFI